jgi:transposase
MWKAIVRPERAEYYEENLGPKEFLVKQKECRRTDLELVNKRGFKLKCCLYEPHMNSD